MESRQHGIKNLSSFLVIFNHTCLQSDGRTETQEYIVVSGDACRVDESMGEVTASHKTRDAPVCV